MCSVTESIVDSNFVLKFGKYGMLLLQSLAINVLTVGVECAFLWTNDCKARQEIEQLLCDSKSLNTEIANRNMNKFVCI